MKLVRRTLVSVALGALLLSSPIATASPRNARGGDPRDPRIVRVVKEIIRFFKPTTSEDLTPPKP